MHPSLLHKTLITANKIGATTVRARDQSDLPAPNGLYYGIYQLLCMLKYTFIVYLTSIFVYACTSFSGMCVCISVHMHLHDYRRSIIFRQLVGQFERVGVLRKTRWVLFDGV